jgi:hypothetical protein
MRDRSFYLQNGIGMSDCRGMSIINCQLYGEEDFLNAWGIDEAGRLWVHADFCRRAATRYEHKKGDLTVTTMPSPQGKFVLASDVFTQASVEEIKASLMTLGN